MTWDGKYDSNGKRAAPLRVALPFQTVETVNESIQDRQHSLDLFADGRSADWRNRLIWGDKKYVLPALLAEFAGVVDLIYIDPPFFTGDDFSYDVEVDGEDFTKEPSLIEQKAFRDTWGRGLDGYVQWFYDTALLLHDLLADNGTIYVHLDWHVGHYAKLVLDEIFGSENFLNNIVWLYGLGGSSARYWPRKHDDIYWYSKKPDAYFFEAARIPATSQRMKGLDKKSPDYWDIPSINNMAEERVAFPTQKPEELLERIITSSSQPGGLVLDCFVGSGTTAVVAEKTGRRWIGCDLSRFAIHTTRKRLLSTPGVRPFAVENLGKYERQLWQVAEFGETAAARSAEYRRFILELYHAKAINGYAWLHGSKGGRLVHVSTVDAPVTDGDIKQIAVEFRKMMGTGKDAPTTTGVDILGWDFAFEVNEIAAQAAAKAGIDTRFFKIPHQVMDKRAVEQGDVTFFELAALAVDLQQTRRRASVTLTDFVIPIDAVPEDVQRAIKKWTQWIDYWAIDWDNKGDAFHNQWQSYRSRKNKDLEFATTHEYEEAGSYTVVVKVIDILGNDTTKTLAIDVR